MCVLCMLIAIYMVFIIFLSGIVYVYNRRRREKDHFEVEASSINSVNVSASHFDKRIPIKVKKRFNSFLTGANKYICNIVSKMPSHFMRTFFLQKVLLVTMGKNVVVYSGTIMRGTYRIEIGAGTIVGDNCILDGRGYLYIGRNCNLSTGVKIWTAQHDVQSQDFAYISSPVKIKDRCWISGDTTILPGVTIGEGCVIASGAVVTKDCEPYGIYAGIPAKRIGERTKNVFYKFDGSHDWFV